MSTIIKKPLRVTVNKILDNNDLLCTSELGAEMKIDPFVGQALGWNELNKPKSVVGKVFEMKDYWLHRSGVFLCHEFKRV